MDKKTYRKIVSEWKKPIYQNVKSKKMNKVLEHIYLFKDKKVVDLGSNAGVITYDIAQYASEFVGVEYDAHYYKQSLLTLKHINTSGKFVNMTVGDFIKTTDFDYNAVFASCVLYHLKTEEIDAIRDVMLPKCDIVIFTAREDKKKKYNNPYDLGKWKKIRNFLTEAGMIVEVYNTNSNWATIIGKKSVKN